MDIIFRQFNSFSQEQTRIETISSSISKGETIVGVKVYFLLYLVFVWVLSLFFLFLCLTRKRILEVLNESERTQTTKAG